MAHKLYKIGDGFAVNFNPKGRFHGWLFAQNADGQWISMRKLEEVDQDKPEYLKYRDPDKWRAYMREYMAKRRKK